MKIYVRRRHIKDGRKNSPGSCPIALACKEMICDRVFVHGTWMLIETIGARDLPRAAQRFINLFDSGKPVKPFAFTIK